VIGLLSAVPVGSTAPSWLQPAVFSGIAAALVAGVFAIIQTAQNKKLRTPADRLAEVEFYVGLAKQQVAEAKEDKRELEATLGLIRTYVETLEANGRADAKAMREQDGLLSEARRRIDQLERRVERKERLATALQQTIDAVAEKVVAGLPITLDDLKPIGFRPASFLDTGEVALVS
jgi:septal ring factor EnvC (AmiA/AmiB activator)